MTTHFSVSDQPMSKHFPRRIGGLTIIQTMALLAILGVVLFFALSLLKREPAPAATFNTLKGEQLSTSSLRGKVVLVNFWATSCGSCIAEMPQMVGTFNKYREQGFELVAVAMSYDPPQYVQNYAETRALPFTVALDSNGSNAKAFGDVQLTPTAFLIDKDGNIMKRFVGVPDEAGLHRLIEKALST
jgi:peroxiredoxin